MSNNSDGKPSFSEAMDNLNEGLAKAAEQLWGKPQPKPRSERLKEAASVTLVWALTVLVVAAVGAGVAGLWLLVL